MSKLNDLLFWTITSLFFGAFLIIVYPFYIFRNLGYHLRAPSVFLYASIIFLFDRLAKMVVNLQLISLPLPVVKNFLTLTYVKNPGVAFGWFPDWRFPPIMMAFVMIVIIAYYSFQLPTNEKLTRCALALLVGGALGNLYDRIVYGFVVDFILFHFGSFDFPVFNIADVAIDLGVALLFIDIFLLNSNEEPDPQATPA
ncbi:signal peptidase II [bacterium]|nr:signal peptidase II [bacterium]